MAAALDLIVVVLRLALAGLALAAAVHKLRDPVRSRRAARVLLGRDGLLADLAWSGAIALEGLGAILTATGLFGGYGPLLLALVWASYALALLRQHRSEDCGCGFGRRSPSHGFGALRNLGLVVLAIAVTGSGDITVAPVAWAAAMPAALVLLLLYLAADELGSHPRLARSRP
jgi:uncharacterized membrane protein YphA (DoxX/SURF4 family)